VVFAGDRADYTITHEEGNGRFVMNNIATGEANYIYDDVETVQFNDGAIATFTGGAPTAELVNDVVSGTDANLSTGSGDDTITLSEGAGHTAYQVVRGGDGSDTVVFSGDRADYTITHEEGNGRFVMNNIATGEANYIYDDVETVQFNDGAIATFTGGVPTAELVNDVVSGTFSNLNTGSGDDTILGGVGNEIIRGGDGNDFIRGGGGDDSAFGDGGSDTYYFSTFDGQDTFSGGEGWTDSIQLDATNSVDPDNPWIITVDGQQIAPVDGENFIEFDGDTSGVVTMADGSTLNFDGVERIEW
jgi:Ca2+-binding RTX toxin-like protein